MGLVIFSVVQLLGLTILTPFALGYFLHWTGITSQAVAVSFLTIWIFGVCIEYGGWFHAYAVIKFMERKKNATTGRTKFRNRFLRIRNAT